MHPEGPMTIPYQPVRSRPAPSPDEPLLLRDTRPWGHFDLLTLNARASVKLLTVQPGGSLSSQRHAERDEWWHVLDSGLSVELDGVSRPCSAGDRVWVPRGTVHRVTNTAREPARFLEIAFGHFDEDDIERLSDDYGRA